MSGRSSRLLLPVLLVAGCVSPPLEPSPAWPEAAGVIRGTVTVSGVAARGDVYIFLLPQAGRPGSCPATVERLVPPRDVVRLPRAEVFADARGETHSAPFVVGQVAEGCWALTALVDADGDFNPLFGATAGATRGDALGGAVAAPEVDGGTPPLRLLEVAPVDGAFEPLDGVQVLVAAEVPLERPSFRLSPADPDVVPTLSVEEGAPLVLELDVVPIQGGWAETANVDEGTGPIFPLAPGPDEDGDGTPDDADADGLPDVGGVTVLLRRLLPAGPGVAPWALDTAFPLALPGRIDARALLGGTTPLPVVPATSLTVVIAPVAFEAKPGTQPKPRPLTTWLSEGGDDGPRSPLGRYAILVVLDATGQTWQLPNELAMLASLSAQAAIVEVAP